MEALVTGCAGFIGSHLVDKLLDKAIGMGLGYVKLFCKQKPLLKKCLRHFLQAKRNEETFSWKEKVYQIKIFF